MSAINLLDTEMMREIDHLGCEDFSAELAKRYGHINRALPPNELNEFVERLGRRATQTSV